MLKNRPFFPNLGTLPAKAIVPKSRRAQRRGGYLVSHPLLACPRCHIQLGLDPSLLAALGGQVAQKLTVVIQKVHSDLVLGNQLCDAHSSE
jgi:hypothetical protein